MIFEILFVIAAFFVGMSMFGYPIVASILSKGKKLKKKNEIENVTVIVPAFNEEKYIERKIKNLLSVDFPKKRLDILVVDNGSTDDTAKIVKKLPVKLIKSERGKINAINEGIKKAKSDIIIVTDADTLIEKKSIRNMCNKICGNIGAVCAYSHLDTKDKRLFYLGSKKIYYEDDWQLRYKEGLIDSVCSLDGKLVAFRKTIVPKLTTKYLSDDFVLTLMVRKKGFRCVVDKDAKVFEELPNNFNEEIKQIRRRLSIGIDAMLGYLYIMFNPRYGFFGMMTFPFRRFLPLSSIFFMLYMAVFLLWLDLFLGGLLIILGVILILLLKGPYFFLQLIGVSLAWMDVILGRTRKQSVWKKIANVNE